MSRIDFVTGAPLRYMPLVDALATVPDRVEAVLRRHPGAHFHRAPAGGDWAPSRVLAHMLSYARHNGGFIYMITWMTDPVRPAWDEEAEIEAEGWLRLDASRAVEALRELIAPTVELLSTTPDASWGRPGGHPRDGRRSLRQQVQAHIDHLEEHTRQIDAAFPA
ncbi:MAG: DinB family protein [Chloroflexi bacterium]|nr:DinB family protein [Chloroflexota bacterium]